MAASPTLMGIPTELRQKIIRNLFDNGATELDYETYLNLSDSEECQNYIKRWNLNHSVLEMPEFGADVAAVVSLTLNVGDHYYNAYPDPENHKPEDFVSNLSVAVRHRVSKIIMSCRWTYQGKHFTKAIFPNLEVVIVDGIVKTYTTNCESVNWGCVTLHFDHHMIHHNVDSDIDWDDLMAGNHDSALVAHGKSIADLHFMRDVGTLDERGFEIFCKCQATIYQLRVNSFSHTYKMFITWNYDTGEAANKDACYGPDQLLFPF